MSLSFIERSFFLLYLYKCIKEKRKIDSHLAENNFHGFQFFFFYIYKKNGIKIIINIYNTQLILLRQNTNQLSKKLFNLLSRIEKKKIR